MAKRNNLIAELLAESIKKGDYISQEIARLVAKAADETNDKMHADLLGHGVGAQRGEAVGKPVKIAAKLEKAKRDWEWEIGLLKKMDGQKAEELREVKRELGSLEKQIVNRKEENNLIENEHDQARRQRISTIKS